MPSGSAGLAGEKRAAQPASLTSTSLLVPQQEKQPPEVRDDTSLSAPAVRGMHNRREVQHGHIAVPGRHRLPALCCRCKRHKLNPDQGCALQLGKGLQAPHAQGLKQVYALKYTLLFKPGALCLWNVRANVLTLVCGSLDLETVPNSKSSFQLSLLLHFVQGSVLVCARAGS